MMYIITTNIEHSKSEVFSISFNSYLQPPFDPLIPSCPSGPPKV